MQIKEIQPINFLFFRKQTTIPLLNDIIPVSQEVYREAVAQRLKITGPIHWHYMGIMDLVSPFTLEISLPVSEVKKDYDGAFHFKRTELYKCASVFHEGSFETIQKSYDKVFQLLAESKLRPTGFNREIYINIDFGNPSASFTELQIGVVGV